MFVSGQSRLANMVFSALTFTVGIPSAIKVFNWVATLYKGDIRLKTPMLYALSFLLLFTIGGLTGLFLGILSVDVHLHDTYFVVAHFHYVMMGSTLVAFLGGAPLLVAEVHRPHVHRSGSAASCAIGVFFGFNLTFLPQFVMGSRGMPRRYWDYDPQYQIFHQLSTIGAFVLGISMFITVMYLMASLKNGKTRAAQPVGWHARSSGRRRRRRRSTTSRSRRSSTSSTTTTTSSRSKRTSGSAARRRRAEAPRPREADARRARKPSREPKPSRGRSKRPSPATATAVEPTPTSAKDDK